MQINRGKGTPAEKTKLHQYIINRISSEVKIAQLIKHPNIVEFIDCAETKNNIYIFFEKCDRYPLVN